MRPCPAPDTPAQQALHWGVRLLPADTPLDSLLPTADVLVAERDVLPAHLDENALRHTYPKLICALIREDGESGGPLAEAVTCALVSITILYPQHLFSASGGVSRPRVNLNPLPPCR